MGFITAPDMEVHCAFSHDAGSGGHPNGKCPYPPNSGHHIQPPHMGLPLGQVMEEHFAACAGELAAAGSASGRDGGPAS